MKVIGLTVPLTRNGTKTSVEKSEDVAMFISPRDFPGDERIAEEIISVLRDIYVDDATMAYMTFARGSVLMQDGQLVTKDTIYGELMNAADRR